MKKFNLLFTLFISFAGFSQTQIINRETQQFATWGLTREIDPNAKIDKASGSPYSLDLFYDAEINISDTIVKVPVRYNVVSDEMEFRRDDKTFALVVKGDVVVNFLLTKKQYNYIQYTLEDVSKKGFLCKKTNNLNINLFVKEVISYIPFKDALNSYDQPKPAHYRKDNDIFLIQMGNDIVEMPTKKKALLKLFNDKEEEIETFLKTNKTSFREETDLIALVNYLNTL